MAIFDAELMFSDKQSVTATAASTTTIDCGQELLTTGVNGGMDLFVLAVATADYTGDGTITVALQDCDSATGTFSTIASAPAVTASEFSRVLIPMPLSHKQYLKLNYTVSGTATGGAITAGITRSVDLPQDYKAEDYDFE